MPRWMLTALVCASVTTMVFAQGAAPAAPAESLRNQLSPSIVISLLALLFSFGTTAASAYRTRQQDLHNARTELRGLIQRMSSLPRENAEMMAKYEAHPLTQASLSALLNQENALIAKQAEEVVLRIRRHVSATEYLAVANAMAASGIAQTKYNLFELAVAAANDVNDEVAALRMFGASLFQVGEAGRGRIQFQTALDVFAKYPTANKYYVFATHVTTERSWAQAEFAWGSADEARAHLERAAALVGQMPPSEPTNQLRGQIQEVARTMQFEIRAIQ